MDREEDRRERANETPGASSQTRNRNVREQIHAATARMRSGADRSGAGHGIDQHMDRITSEQAIHTKERPGEGADATARDTIEEHRREMQLAAIAGANQRRRDGHTDAAQADTPAQARKIEKQADRDYKKDPQGLSGPKKTPRIQINADKLRAGTEKAREIGGTLVRALTASPKSGTKSRGGYTATNGALFQLARPNGGNMHYGGNRDAIAPQRPSPVLTKQQLERSRTRSDSAPRR